MVKAEELIDGDAEHFRELRQELGGPMVGRALAIVNQAHMIHEFREFAGITPTRDQPRSAGEPNHARL